MSGRGIRRGPRYRGSALVELALVFPLLATLLIGVADFGQYLFLQQALVERARFAARWGAVTDPSNSTAITNMVLYLQSAPAPGAVPAFGLAPAMVQVAVPDSGTDQQRLVVTISGYSFKLWSPAVAGSYAGPAIRVSIPLGPYA